MKVKFEKDEFYPYYYPNTKYPDFELEVPEDWYARYVKAQSEFEKMSYELGKMIDAQDAE